jgi:phage-related protein
MGTAFARIGTTAGIAFAGAFIVHAGSAITALSPLLLAAIGGLGIFAQIKMWGVKKEDGKWVINMATRMGRAIKGLKNEFKDFLQFATDPLFEPIIKSLKIITAYLNDLRGPVARFFGEFGKALPDLTRGVMKGIIEFFRALDPILKSGAFREGLREWGRQFPKIGKALGEFFAKVLANPDKVIDTIKRLGQDLVTLAHGAATLVTVLTDAMQIYDRFASWVDRFENSTSGKGGPLGGMLNALKGFKPAFEQAFNSFRAWAEPKLAALGAWIQDKFWRALDWLKALAPRLKALIGQGFASAVASLRQHLNEAVTAVKGFVDKVINWLKTLPPRGRAAIVLLPARLMSVFNIAVAQAVAKARDLVNRVVAFLKTLPAKARSAVAALWSRMSSVFSSAVSNARARATSLVNGVINFLKTLPGKARSAVSRLWSSMSSAFSSAVSNARTKGKALVDGFINALKAIVSRARAQVNAAKNAIKAAFAGAGSWLVSAGRSIMTGLASGIRSGASAAVSAAISAARSALAAAKSALKIASPSKVFAEEVGKPIAQGIGVGMRKQIPEEFGGLGAMMPAMAGVGSGSGAASKSYSTTFSPTINIQTQAGLNELGAANRRALTRDVFLALEQYRKDYVDR